MPAMIRKPSLSAALHEASGKKLAVPETVTQPSSPVGIAPSRVGKRSVTGHFDPAVVRQLKLLAIDRDTSIQGLLAEALNDLFEKHKLNPVA